MYSEKKPNNLYTLYSATPFVNLWVRSIKIGLTCIIMWATGQGHVLDNTAACSTVVDYITERKITECPIRCRVKVDVCVAVWHGDLCIADLQNETRCCEILKGTAAPTSDKEKKAGSRRDCGLARGGIYWSLETWHCLAFRPCLSLILRRSCRIDISCAQPKCSWKKRSLCNFVLIFVCRTQKGILNHVQIHLLGPVSPDSSEQLLCVLFHVFDEDADVVQATLTTLV